MHIREATISSTPVHDRRV